MDNPLIDSWSDSDLEEPTPQTPSPERVAQPHWPPVVLSQPHWPPQLFPAPLIEEEERHFEPEISPAIAPKHLLPCPMEPAAPPPESLESSPEGATTHSQVPEHGPEGASLTLLKPPESGPQGPTHIYYAPAALSEVALAPAAPPVVIHSLVGMDLEESPPEHLEWAPLDLAMSPTFQAPASAQGSLQWHRWRLSRIL